MRSSVVALAALLTLALATPAHAQQGGAGEDTPQIATPPLGVQKDVRRGLFAEVQLGTFFTLNGTAGARPVSNAMPLLGLGVGLDLGDRFNAGLSVTHGASQGTCFAGGPEAACAGSSAFSVVAGEAFVGYLHPLTHDWFVGGRVMGGATLLSPAPVNTVGQEGGAVIGYLGGVMFSTELHTHLDHFVVGLDAGFRYIAAPEAGIPGISIHPHLKYVF